MTNYKKLLLSCILVVLVLLSDRHFLFENAFAEDSTAFIEHAAANPGASAAYKWVDILLEASARSVERAGARPTILSREMEIVTTAMYDAWAAYDDKAIGTRLGSKLRRPVTERSKANKEAAIGYAAYRALLFLYPEDTAWIAEQARAMGVDSKDGTADTSTPLGVGNAVAAAIIEYRRRDGSNQLGDEAGSNGKPYSDYTFYESRNTVEKLDDPDRWQPIPFDNPNGAGKIAPGFLTPHWYRVKPFALERSDQFRPGPPPKVGSDQLKKDVDECIAFNGNLSLEQKAIVEFMRDGPRSTGQSGHWLRFAQDVSRRDHFGLDQDVKLFFSVANVAFDAFIAAWDAKRYYDSSRPWTLVRYFYKGQKVVGYCGSCKGFALIPAEEWSPYSPATFVTPPFPGYVSGHSAVSGASSKMLELFTGNDRFGVVAHRSAGALTEPGCDPSVMQRREGQPRSTAVPASAEIALTLQTFTATAEMAGISRIMGGYHIPADNTAGLDLGRKVALYSWQKYQAYFGGTASAQTDPKER